MNTGNIVAGIGFILSYAALVLMETWQKSGALLKGAATASTTIGLITLVAGMSCVVIGIGIATLKKQ